MSESDGISNHSGPASAAEPSMEEILASIRRILSEEEEAAQRAQVPDDELLLDASMRVRESDLSDTATEQPALEPETEPAPVAEHFATDPALHIQPMQKDEEELAPITIMPDPESVTQTLDVHFPLLAETGGAMAADQEKDVNMEEQVQRPEGLVGEQAVSEISNSIGALVRSVSVERAASVGRAGITIEDIVREEVKPVLKAWLDTHLPSLVERMVRAEINRVMDRAQD